MTGRLPSLQWMTVAVRKAAWHIAGFYTDYTISLMTRGDVGRYVDTLTWILLHTWILFSRKHE